MGPEADKHQKPPNVKPIGEKVLAIFPDIQKALEAARTAMENRV